MRRGHIGRTPNFSREGLGEEGERRESGEIGAPVVHGRFQIAGTTPKGLSYLGPGWLMDGFLSQAVQLRCDVALESVDAAPAASSLGESAIRQKSAPASALVWIEQEARHHSTEKPKQY